MLTLTAVPVRLPCLCASVMGRSVLAVYPGPEAIHSVSTAGKTRPLTSLISETISALWPFSLRHGLTPFTLQVFSGMTLNSEAGRADAVTVVRPQRARRLCAR